MREIENLFSRSEAFFSEPNFVKRLVVRSPKGKYSKTCAGKIWSSAAVATHCRRKGREFDQRENEVLFTGRVAWQRTGLAAVWAFEIYQPVTEVDDCNIADVLFIAKFITSCWN